LTSTKANVRKPGTAANLPGAWIVYHLAAYQDYLRIRAVLGVM